MRRFQTMTLVAAALAMAAVLAISAGSAAASPAAPSAGCTALNNGAWDFTLVGPPNFTTTFSELDFFTGEVINVSINVESIETTGGGSFHLDAFDPFVRFFSVSSGFGPFPATNFPGQYTITGSGDLSLGASMGANNSTNGAVTNISNITCTPLDSDGDGDGDGLYTFSGFSDPVDADAMNVAKAGQAIPLKFRVTDASGAPVTDLTDVTVKATLLSCSSGSTTDDLVEEYASGDSGLQNLGDGYYQFNWKTPKSYASSCKTMSLELGDGAQHTAQFEFRK